MQNCIPILKKIYIYICSAVRSLVVHIDVFLNSAVRRMFYILFLSRFLNISKLIHPNLPYYLSHQTWKFFSNRPPDCVISSKSHLMFLIIPGFEPN